MGKEKFCIVDLKLSISRITEDVFKISDDSVFSFSELKGNSGSFCVKIKSKHIKDFHVDIPLGGSVVCSSKELGIPCLRDGMFCFEVESCGNIFEEEYLYAGNILCSIEENVTRFENDDHYIKMMNKWKVLEVLGRNGMVEGAERKYNELWRLLQACGIMVGSRLWRPRIT